MKGHTCQVETYGYKSTNNLVAENVELKKALAMHVVCKILVLMLSDVVRLKICKYTNIKDKARYSVKHESL